MKNSMDFMPILMGGVFFLMGSAFFSVSVFFIIRKMSRMKSWTKTKGVVVNVEISSGMRQSHGRTRNTLFKPTVRYQAADGRVIDYTPKTSNSWSNYDVGQELEILYNPQQPADATIGASSGQWFGLIVFAVVGGFFALFGVFFLLFGVFFRF